MNLCVHRFFVTSSHLRRLTLPYSCGLYALYFFRQNVGRENTHHHQYCCVALSSQGYSSHRFYRVYLHLPWVLSCVATTARSPAKPTIIILSGTEKLSTPLYMMFHNREPSTDTVVSPLWQCTICGFHLFLTRESSLKDNFQPNLLFSNTGKLM